MDTTTAVTTLGLPVWPIREDELRRAWRHFARRHHPDRCPGDAAASTRFDRGRRAYEALRGEIASGVRHAPIHRSFRAGTVRGNEAAAAAVHSFDSLSTRQWRA